MATRVSPKRMARLVRQWRASGEASAAFARRHGVAPWTFWYWRHKLDGSRAAGAEAPPSRVVPVQIVPDARSGAVEIVLPGGERVVIDAGAPAALVQTVLSALRPAC